MNGDAPSGRGPVSSTRPPSTRSSKREKKRYASLPSHCPDPPLPTLTPANTYQHPLGTTKHRPRTPSPNSDRPLSHSHNCPLPLQFLLHLRNSPILASTPTLPSLHFPILNRTNIRRSQRPKQLPPLTANMVRLRLILPCNSPQRRSAPTNKEIHIRLPPTRHNIPRRIRSLRHRSPRLQQTIPGNHKHPLNPGLELPHPLLQRLRTSHGPRERIARILRKHPLQGRRQ